ncbi:unnamed protein product [Caenorhabditis auriculariae]|uniref:Uncharacterized protein n=1 Tax=Caenorhabditis auriculariae TaxID=2777116 RepID=A0A8S1I088_9PELO|nr:unnamed protein product [Caenorhabditis auriculariae]
MRFLLIFFQLFALLLASAELESEETTIDYEEVKEMFEFRTEYLELNKTTGKLEVLQRTENMTQINEETLRIMLGTAQFFFDKLAFPFFVPATFFGVLAVESVFRHV